MVAGLASGTALVSINLVTLRQTRLVPGWVTVLGRVNDLGAQPDTQVYSAWAILAWVDRLSAQPKLGE